MSETPTPTETVAKPRPKLRIVDAPHVTAMVAIDEHVIDAQVTRLRGDAFHEFSRAFRRMQESHTVRQGIIERRLLAMTPDECARADKLAAEEDERAEQFMLDSVQRYVTFLPGQVYEGDTEITTGADVVRVLKHRRDVLIGLLAEIMRAASTTLYKDEAPKA